ncbi:hypothetical protein FMUND_8672 [Fusarium mundagurra]|uniref:Protein CAP22 n=1 Tax=Fusarium mundagurra TaxID=1567541 RepID=A0A8H6DD00_9HYPO|nr:hypothetical protein FMUND_8672 [Fusarium mundagurra]
MHSAILLAALVAFIPTAFAEELSADDVPAACKTICQPIVNLTNACDIDPKGPEKHSDRRRDLVILDHEDDDEPIEAACICTNKSFDVEGVMGLCASCMAQNSKDTEDIDKIMSQCSFLSTSYIRAATSVVSGIEVQATKPAATITPVDAVAVEGRCTGIGIVADGCGGSVDDDGFPSAVASASAEARAYKAVQRDTQWKSARSGTRGCSSGFPSLFQDRPDLSPFSPHGVW